MKMPLHTKWLFLSTTVEIYNLEKRELGATFFFRHQHLPLTFTLLQVVAQTSKSKARNKVLLRMMPDAVKYACMNIEFLKRNYPDSPVIISVYTGWGSKSVVPSKILLLRLPWGWAKIFGHDLIHLGLENLPRWRLVISASRQPQ